MSRRLPARRPQAERRHFVFVYHCGCPFGLVEEGTFCKSEDDAWDSMYDTRTEERQARAKASGLASTIRNGKTVCFTPAGDFDAVCRTVGNVCMTYARYLGDGPAPIHTNHVGEEPR